MRSTPLVLFLFFALNATSQVVKGVISDSLGNPLEGAAVYVDEKKQGLVVGSDGIFQLHLESGSYNLTFMQPEHTHVQRKVIISQKDTTYLCIQLDRKELQKTIQPSNTEIRNRIVQQLERLSFNTNYHTAYSYVRGEMIIKKVSNFIDKLRMKVENQKLSDLKDTVIGHEIYARINNLSTDSCRTSIINQNGKIPEEWNSIGILEYLSSSLYQERFQERVSPLNLNTIRYYDFIYLGSYYNNRELIHKIRIESSIKDSDLLRGYFYFDPSWNLYYADLNITNQGLDQNIRLFYSKLDDIYSLPIAVFIENKVNLLGTKVDVKYQASLIYNQSSTKETYLSEISFNENESYWGRIRILPALESGNDKILPMQKEKYNPSNYWLGRILLGDYALGNDTSKWKVRYGGVKMVFRDYNYVDGFWLGQKFDITGQLNEKYKIEIEPYVYCLTARHRIAGGSDFSFYYNRRRSGVMTLSFGSKSTDFNNLSITRYQNYFTSLIFGENCNFFYQKDFVSVSNKININKKLRLSTSFGIEKRHGLSNHTDFTIIDRNRIKPNIYPDDRFDHTYYAIGLSYSPTKEYYTSDALEVYKKNITPIISLDYQEGFSSWQTNNSKYRKLKGGVIHNIRVDHFNKIDLKLEGGVFLNNRKKAHFSDYQHFGASDMLLNLNSLFDSFLLLDNYELQTNKYWFNTFLNYSGKYFLLKRIPFLQGKSFSENIHLKTLFTPDVDLYNEFGYSISFNRYIGIGGFVSFSNTQVKKVGVRFSLNLRSLGLGT